MVIAAVAVKNEVEHLDRVQRRTFGTIKNLAAESYREAKGMKRKKEKKKKGNKVETGEHVVTLLKHEKLLQRGKGIMILNPRGEEYKEEQSQPSQSRFDICYELLITLKCETM